MLACCCQACLHCAQDGGFCFELSETAKGNVAVNQTSDAFLTSSVSLSDCTSWLTNNRVETTGRQQNKGNPRAKTSMKDKPE